MQGEAAASVLPTPSLPRRPTTQVEEEEEEPSESPRSSMQSPAAALAGVLTQRKSTAPSARALPPQYTPEASDDDEPTPSLPARPISVRALDPIETSSLQSPASSMSRGVAASPPHNRVSMSQLTDDEPAHRAPGGFHMYNINEMVSVMGKRKKMPTTLGINSATGVILIAPEKGSEQEWTAEKMTHYSIEGKHVFLELVRPSKSVDFHAGAKDTAEEIVGTLGELAGAVRAEGLREVFLAGSGQGQKTGQVLYDFMAQGDDEVTVAVGDEVIVIDDTKSEEWWQVRRIRNGKEGVVPSSYVEITGTTAVPSATGTNAGKSIIDQNRLDEERLAKESLKAARREEDVRGSEVGPGMRLPERGSSLSARDSGNNHGQQRSRRENSRNESGPTRSSKSSEFMILQLRYLILTCAEPDPTKVRTWTDRSKSFSVEAQFLALKDGKINLHKMNGVKIAVPVVKMSVEDLEYVESITGVSLDEDKPLSSIKRQQTQRNADSSRDSAPSSGAGASVEQSQKPEYDWFQFFLSCDVAVGLCERYAQTFHKDSMDESVLPDVDATVLRTLGIREGDIIKIMRFLDKKFGRPGGKRNVSFGGEEVIDGDSPGGLFSGPGGTLRNNTRKGRPAPAVQTNDIVDPKAFSQESKDMDLKPTPEGVATPPASVPVPTHKDIAMSGFDDDAWDVKPSKQRNLATSSQSNQSISGPAPGPPLAPQQPALTGSMQELSLLSQPLEPIRTQPTINNSHPQLNQGPQPQATQGATPSFFQGIGQQQTGLSQQQKANQFNAQINLPQNIARQRPPPPQFQNSNQGSLMIPAPPSRPLSAPQANQNSGFAPPPLMPQSTGMQNSMGFQAQLAPPGQSLDEIRMRQQFTGFNSQNGQQNMGMMPQPTGFQFNGMQQNSQPQNGFQYPMQTGVQQQQFMNNGGGPFADPRSNQFSPVQQQPTGFQASFIQPQQQFPQTTGLNSFLPPALQPTPTGMQNQNNGFSSNFNPPQAPQMPQQTAPAPLIPQKTGPPPPVRFGVSGDTKKLMPQATGRRANLAQASK